MLHGKRILTFFLWKPYKTANDHEFFIIHIFSHLSTSATLFDTSHLTALKGQAKNKGPKYQWGEINCLLELAQEKIPISGEDWDDIARQHYLQYPDKDRNGDSLKRKFY